MGADLGGGVRGVGVVVPGMMHAGTLCSPFGGRVRTAMRAQGGDPVVGAVNAIPTLAPLIPCCIISCQHVVVLCCG